MPTETEVKSIINTFHSWDLTSEMLQNQLTLKYCVLKAVFHWYIKFTFIAMWITYPS